MSKLPQSSTKTYTRKRILSDNGAFWGTWWTITPEGDAIIDPNYHMQLKRGSWRFIIEREVKTITYEECEQ